MTTSGSPLDAALLRDWQLPLDDDGDKHTRGTVLMFAGSPITAGAALLSGTAALRMGAGRLQLATAAAVSAGVSIAMPEAMELPLCVDATNELDPAQDWSALDGRLADARSVLIGPGMFGRAGLAALIERVASQAAEDAVVVLDAAALEALPCVSDGARRSLARRLVLTPNRQELERLGDAVDAPGNAEVARQLGAVVTSFGEVAAFDGRRWSAAPASPGLGTSGSGDVLAGLVAGAAARCGDPAQAACWATFVHAESASGLAERFGVTSFIARELLDEAPSVLADLERAGERRV